MVPWEASGRDPNHGCARLKSWATVHLCIWKFYQAASSFLWVGTYLWINSYMGGSVCALILAVWPPCTSSPSPTFWQSPPKSPEQVSTGNLRGSWRWGFPDPAHGQKIWKYPLVLALAIRLLIVWSRGDHRETLTPTGHMESLRWLSIVLLVWTFEALVWTGWHELA